MKKAKIMLVAIATFAVVGGVLAFKAKSAFNTKIIYWTTSFNTKPPLANTAVATLVDAPGLVETTISDTYYTTTTSADATTDVIFTGSN
jgi:hypothetical protein